MQEYSLSEILRADDEPGKIVRLDLLPEVKQRYPEMLAEVIEVLSILEEMGLPRQKGEDGFPIPDLDSERTVALYVLGLVKGGIQPGMLFQGLTSILAECQFFPTVKKILDVLGPVIEKHRSEFSIARQLAEREKRLREVESFPEESPEERRERVRELRREILASRPRSRLLRELFEEDGSRKVTSGDGS